MTNNLLTLSIFYSRITIRPKEAVALASDFMMMATANIRFRSAAIRKGATMLILVGMWAQLHVSLVRLAASALK